MSKSYLKHVKHQILFSHRLDLFKPNGVCNPIGFLSFGTIQYSFYGVAGHIMYSLLGN